ncbi:hypothetical protein GCM10017784_35200 [Deinococcus indicus]|uniref:hypothetical protein n=1 Tax=Deinococcus indicus TaxID=223556 RepID=UPI00174A1AA6|nr:hypothetical protein [Deinococcus indicus]GHG37713.1 hypothetical protein GCM10017784_35200 [Deinococcus indicus]
MTTPPTPQPQPAPLPERVQQVLDATSGHTAGPWTYNEGSICHGYEVRDGKRTATWIADIDHQNQDDYADDGYHSYSPQADRDAALIAAAPTLRALLAEAAAALAAAEAERDALRAALERVNAVQVQWWEQVIALMDPDAPETPVLQERAETLKRCNHELRAALGGQS